MPRSIRLLAVLALLGGVGCQADTKHRPAAAEPHWEIRPGLWRTDYLNGDAADVSCVDSKQFSAQRSPPQPGCTVLHFQALADGFVAEGRCQTDYKPTRVRNETRALNSETVLVTFSQNTEGEPGPPDASHMRMTFVGACPRHWREGDWLDLKPSDGRWRVLRMPPSGGRRRPDPVMVLEYHQLPPELAKLR